MVERASLVRGIVVVVCLLGCVATAAADATVHLKNGGRVRGELMEVVPEQSASVMLRDGSVRRIGWADIARIDDDVGGAPAPATVAAAGADGDGRRAALDRDLDALQRERGEINQGGNVVMMVAGYILAPLVLAGVPLMLVGETCTGDQCIDLFPTGLVLTALGGVGITLGVIGLTSAMDNGARRKELDQEIDRKTKERDSLGYAFGSSPLRGPQLQLSVQF